jgi:hypothetical protein
MAPVFVAGAMRVFAPRFLSLSRFARTAANFAADLVEDLPALKTLIEAAGYSFNTDEPLAGYDRIYVNDPFGNRIELMEPLSK